MKRRVFKFLLIVMFLHSLPDYCFGQEAIFVSKNFKVPDSLVTIYFKLKPLSKKYAEKDYSAVMQSIDHLKGVFGPKSDWPQNNLTLEDDQWDVALHEKEFISRKSFTYTVTTIDESKVLGCVYIYPSSKKDYDAEIAMWVSKPAFDNGMDPVLFVAVKNWIIEQWPFKIVAYPGREISWKEWVRD